MKDHPAIAGSDMPSSDTQPIPVMQSMQPVHLVSRRCLMLGHEFIYVLLTC